MIFFNRMKNTLPKKKVSIKFCLWGRNLMSSQISFLKFLIYHNLHIILLINHLTMKYLKASVPVTYFQIYLKNLLKCQI